MRTILKAAVAILLLAALAWASDPWKTKPYEQWDQKDISQILGDSPWAKVISVNADWEPGQMEQGQKGLPGVAQEGDQSGLSRDPQGPRSGRDMGMSMPNQRQAVYMARWLSAQTVREALARSAELDGRMKQADVERYLSQKPEEYQVAIMGRDMTPFQGISDADLAKDFQIEGKKSKVKLLASQARVDRTPDGNRVIGVIFNFPKEVNGKPVFAANEKEIELVCKLKQVTLKFHFDPQKMESQSGTDL